MVLLLLSLTIALGSDPTPTVVDTINARFVKGVASKNLTKAGLLIHQFDDLEDESKPWEPCSISAGTCWFKNPFDDRVSCSILNDGMPKVDGKIGLFSYGVGGVILSPPSAKMTCSYPGDGGSMTRVGGGCGCQNDTSPAPPVTPGGPSPGPKCLEKLPCDNRCDPAGAGPFMKCHQCAYNSDQLDEMMNAQIHPYNEILVSSADWISNLPATIEAFFYVNDASCGPTCKAKVIKAHSDFLHAYPAAKAPVLALDPTNKATTGPFTCDIGC
jgi:hypothetical protein